MSLTPRDFLTEIYDGLSGYVGIFSTDAEGNWNRSKFYPWPQQAEDAILAVEWDWSSTVGYSPFVYSEARRATDPKSTTRLIALDADYHTADEFRIEPTYIIETSPGSFHLGWLLLTPISQAQAVEVGRSMRDVHGLEASASSTTKILRIPGTHNSDSEKATAAGNTFPVVGTHTGLVYELSDLIEAYPPISHHAVAPGATPAPAHIPPFPESLPSKFAIESKLPAHTPRIDLLMEWRAEEQFGEERNKRSERIHELCHLLFEAGLEPEDVVAYAWEAFPVQEHYVQKSAPRPIRDFWRYDVIPAWNHHQSQEQAYVQNPDHMSQIPDIPAAAETPETPNVTETVTTRKPEPEQDFTLLTDEDRAALEGYDSFIDKWIRANRAALDSRTPVVYAQSTGYLLLTSALADVSHTFRPRNGTPLRMNVFFLTLGPTTSGKSESRYLMLNTLKHVEESMGRETFIGTDATAEGLVRSLSTFDGRPALFATDEVSRMFSDWAAKKYASGTADTFLELYTNQVPRLRRASKDTDMTQNVRLGGFSAYLMGTPEKVYELIPEDFYFSGFMQRVIPVLGFKDEESDEDYLRNQMDQDMSKVKAYRAIPGDIGQTLLDLRTHYGSGDHPIPMTQEALFRFAHLKLQMKKTTENHDKREYLAAIMERLGDSVLKLALALATADKSEYIELKHILRVAQDAEQWVQNVFTIYENVSASEFSRRTEDALKWVISRGGRVSPQSFHTRMMAFTPRDRADILDSLRQQGRLMPFEDDKKRHWLIATEV